LHCRGIRDIHLFLPHFQTLLQQVQRDDNVRTLFQAIHEAFEFAEDANALRNMKPDSRQARILEEMLQCVFEIGKFIELYAKHVGVGKPSWPLSDNCEHVICRNAGLEEYLRTS
jgi:hypothetical protein